MSEQIRKMVSGDEKEWDEIKEYAKENHRTTPNRFVIMAALKIVRGEYILARPEENIQTRRS